MIPVSVIIPTRNRPEFVVRALQSVLAQTYPSFEIIVVVDGPDTTTDPARLEAMDARITVLGLPENVGLAEARNQGILRASGRWIALLDDDDEWLPRKLELQVKRAEQLGGDYVFVPCRFLERTRTVERVMPIRLPDTSERFSEYMYCEGGYLQPSMYFMSRALCLEIPFTKGLRHIEDSDWLLRVTRHPQMQVAGVEEALSIYYNLKSGDRESETTPWRHPLAWAVANHAFFTRKAFPYFVARLCLNARRAGEPFSVFLHLLRTARQYGKLSPRVCCVFLAYWLVPAEALRRWRNALHRTLGGLKSRQSLTLGSGRA